nr:MAG TPA: hypothetical protein [Caudoviricetes sp.]
MKFTIGIESLLHDSTEENKMLVQLDDSMSYVDDNIYYLESQDYKSAMESINNEIGLLINQSSDMIGTEADNTAKKVPIYKRMWDAIMKLFSTLGEWISRGFDWVANKFRKGGVNDVAGLAEAEVSGKSEAVQSTKEEMNKEGGLTPTEIKNHVHKVLTNEFKKHEATKKGLGKIIIKRMVNEVTEAIVEASEPASSSNTDKVQKSEDSGDKLVLPESATIKIYYWMFSDTILQNVSKKGFLDAKDYNKDLTALKDTKVNGFVRVNAIAATDIVEHCVMLVSDILGTNYNTMKNLYNKLRVYSKTSWAKYESPITVKELGEANQIIREFESTFKDIASRDENIFEMVRKEVEIRVLSNNNKLNSFDVERFLNTDDFKRCEVLSERIMDMCSYIGNISKTLVKNINNMYNSMKSGNIVGINEFGDKEVDAKPVVIALKAIAMDVKSIANSTLKIIGKSTTQRIADNAKKLSDIKERSNAK